MVDFTAPESTIMIVDDELEHIESLKQILDQFGFNLQLAMNGYKVFELLEDTLPDIILLDVLMPEMDGFEVCRRLKSNKTTKNIPVILMTSLTETVNKVTGLELGAADYITKPFQKEEVLARLKAHFVMRQLHLQLDKTRQTLDDEVSLRTMELTKSNEQLKKQLAEHKRMEKILKQAQKMEAISTLSSGIAHDFNNILSIIIGYCEMAAMEKQPDDSKIGDCLEKISSAAFRAKELVQHLLTFCRQTEQEKKHIKITPILNYVLNYLKANFSSSIEIKQEIREETGTVLADPAQIHQLILNLCQNAGQVMTEDGGMLSIGLKQIFLDPESVSEYPNLISGHYVSIVVEDTGPGMDQEIVERIFDPYFTTKEPGEGTGLGLAVAQGIAVSHGGTIVVASQPGKGSSFEVLLPCRQTESYKPDIKGDQTLPRGSGNVLFVDDEDALVDFGKIVLERVGYKVEGYTSSIEALEEFKKTPQKFDLVITDHIMPKLQGMELAKKILKVRGNIPVMLCTGTKSEELIEHAKAAGIVEVIQKPIPMKTLIKLINNILAKK
ncbi:response regulator [Desulfobacula phenolica]|uniref:histidine kinase n=1 Tax=Desulfobacula phenolica TaxID=90732 RepID=A0A1H2J910_9BACT|nr:response regulator [Desulfobacula phenolica]SDU52656.1 His Kinase A (phospho-acceptor) domain-containing protein [Desulfobacula phenolica]